MCGVPVIYEDICLVKSPKLKEIAATGLDKFYQYLSLIMIEKPTMEDQEVSKLLSPLSDFEYLILLSQMDVENNKLISAAFEFFTEDKPTFIPEKSNIVLGSLDERRILTKDNFSGFQDLVGLSCAMRDPSEETIIIYEDDSPKVKELKMQMIQGRKDRKKSKHKSKGKESNLTLPDLVGSLAIGTGSYNIINVWDLTYYAFQDQLKRMSWREEFDINTRASLAGAKIDKNKLSHWIKTMSFN